MDYKEKMRIVQLGPMPPPHGGVSTNMLAIHEKLLSFGHESNIIEVTKRNSESKSEDSLKPHSPFGLLKLLAGLDCDIIHYHIGGNFTTRLALLTWFCGLLPAKKSVVTFHSGGYARDAVGWAKPFSLRGFAFRSADLLIGVNSQMIEMFTAYGVAKSRTRLIPPFELKRPDPSVSLPSDLEACSIKFDPFLLSVGALEPEYLNGFLIESMPRVLVRWPEAGLMIVGSGSQEKSIREQIALANLDERVIVAGNLEHAAVLHLIEKADVLMRVTDYDGDAVSVREAIFLGTSVIASDNEMRPVGVFLLKQPLTLEELLQGLTEAKEVQFVCPSDSIPSENNTERVVGAYRELLSK